MSVCPGCGEGLSEQLAVCSMCGRAMERGAGRLDEYTLERVVNEGPDSRAYRASKNGTAYYVRVFKAGWGWRARRRTG